MALKKFEGLQTEWGGLWYDKITHSYKSTGINFSLLRQFKGTVRLIVRRNTFYNKGSSRPNFVFTLRDSQLQDSIELKAEEPKKRPYYDYASGWYFDEDGNRLYTEKEVVSRLESLKDDIIYGESPDDCLVRYYL